MKTVEGVDYYINELGQFVFTAAYHLKRGYCCGNGCKHCPFDYINIKEPQRTYLIKKQKAQNDEGKQ